MGLIGTKTLTNKPYKYPPLKILKSKEIKTNELDKNDTIKGERLLHILKTYGIEAKLIDIVKGSSIATYVLKLKDGMRVNRIKSIISDIELNLPAKHVRIIPIADEMAIGIELPTDTRQMVYFRDVLTKIDKSKYKIPCVLGSDIRNNPICIDITETPHLLIAGSTGSGKSVCINSLITSILYSKKPDEVKLILVDPKLVELSVYNGIPHLIKNVITSAKETIKMLDWLLATMDKRYEKLKKVNARNIESYNKRTNEKLKRIVLVIDEFADLMATNQKEIEPKIARLAAMARAVGIHLVLATQRPSANVITGLIKANIPSRIAFQVSSYINSRIILDESGAEKLIGKGDMLLSLSSEQDLLRVQGAYLSDDEVEKIVESIS